MTMKTRRIQRFAQGIFAVALGGVITLTCVPANGAGELIYGIDQYNNLFSFSSAAPGSILSQHAISGLQPNEEIRGIDYWNGTFYGLGSFSHLYTLDPNTGAGTQLGGVFSPVLNGATFGVDNDLGGFRVVSGLNQYLLVDRGTAGVTVEPSLSYAAGDPFFGVLPRVDAIAYNPFTGNWYAADTLQNTLARFNPATGLLSTIGALGIDAARYNGFDISPATGIMYMDTPAASSDPQANLYIVNPVTGAASLVGLIGSPGDDILVRGLTVVPEPSAIPLVALGVLGLLFAHRRQR